MHAPETEYVKPFILPRYPSVMEIPALFATYRDDGLKATDGIFTKISARAGDRLIDFKKASSDVFNPQTRSQVVVIDCDSLELREFTGQVMKRLTIRGMDVWFMTCIRTVDDVFDAFNKDAEFVLAPYHFVSDREEWQDICDVSDSVMPTLFVRDGKALLNNGRYDDITYILDKLVSLGFYKNCILDIDGSVDDYTWSVIAEDYPSTVPFVDSDSVPNGFSTYIRPYLI